MKEVFCNRMANLKPKKQAQLPPTNIRTAIDKGISPEF